MQMRWLASLMEFVSMLLLCATIIQVFQAFAKCVLSTSLAFLNASKPSTLNSTTTNAWASIYFVVTHHCIDDPLLIVRREGVKFAHDIQNLRLIILKKWVALAWVFMCIRDEMVKQGVLHCDLSPSNNYFLVQFWQELHVGVSNWGPSPKLRSTRHQFSFLGA